MKKGEVPTCSAFPDFIPKEVFSERIPHHKKMENQCGDFVFIKVACINSSVIF